jgi:drug/metabolite transporter (DMT)-like permease
MAACLLGLGAVLAKSVGESFDPLFAAWLILLGGAVCTLIFQLVRRRSPLTRLPAAGWGDVLLFAGVGTALPLLCVLAGLPQTGAITGGFLLQLQAPAALLFALVLLKETIIWKQVAGIGLLLAGSILVILGDWSGSVPLKASLGDVLVLIAALGIGFSYIPGKRLTQYGDALQINLLRLFVGSAVLLPFLAFHHEGALVPLSWPLVGLLALYIVTNFGLGYTLLQAGLALLPAWTVSAITQTLPLFTTVFALLLLHESLTLLQIAGGAIILAGGFLAISTPRKGGKDEKDSPTGWDRPVLLRRS